MRRTKSTLRIYKPLARAIAEEANRLDLASRRLHRLAEQVNDAEIDAGTLDSLYKAKVKPPVSNKDDTGLDGLTWKEKSMHNVINPALVEGQ